MSRSSVFLSQISDALCYLGDVERAVFEATLKSSAFLFEDLRINVTDILSNQFFFDVFADEEVAWEWLSADRDAESAVLRPVLFQGDSFEEVAISMRDRGTILSLKRPEDLLSYARRLDSIRPAFVKAGRPAFRGAYAQHLKRAVSSLVQRGQSGVSKDDLRRTGDWLDGEVEGGPVSDQIMEIS